MLSIHFLAKNSFLVNDRGNSLNNISSRALIPKVHLHATLRARNSPQRSLHVLHRCESYVYVGLGGLCKTGSVCVYTYHGLVLELEDS